MKTPGYSESDALRAAKPAMPIRPQWVEGVRIESAREHLSQRDNETIELVCIVPDGSGGERTIKTWLTGIGRNATLTRHVCEAVGALKNYESGEITPDLFHGHTIAAKIGIRRQRSFPDQNTIDDVRASAGAGVMNLRRAG